ncbi:competence/damage-inducible protein A [Aquipuribacter sp. MA13-6]|uniref:competence/damage-inducible protein A n=1 Tax=unclassified Aquipuribacter TaxID=2635084 RepID=UPI003EEE7127
MGARAAVLVTGTEVLTGRVPDANGPWLAERLRELGVDIGVVVVVGDRPEDLASVLRYLRTGHDLVITTGGLGPTADDLTVEVVADVLGRPTAVDQALQERIAAVIARLSAARGWSAESPGMASGTRKQAVVPVGAHVLEPVGTAPGLVLPGDGDGPPVLVLPGPPQELQAMWAAALADPLVAAALQLAGAVALREETIRATGVPEAELADLLREHASRHGAAEDAGLEVTTCLRDGDLEVVTRFRPDADTAYAQLLGSVVDRFGEAVYSSDGSSLDEVVASGLRSHGWTVATAESCTAGLLAGRLADLPGSSDYLVGGFVAYTDEVKTSELGVPAELLSRHGAVSEQVAVAMARGARDRFGSTLAVSVTGIAGPGGARPGKPVGLVHVALDGPDGTVHRELRLRGGRAQVRARTVTTCLHLLRSVLR